MLQLEPNTTLQDGKYRIEKVLGRGGFGITYLAEQVMLSRRVAVKEFFMKEYCSRDETSHTVTMGVEGSRATVARFREKFVKEARNLARLHHANIVSVIDIFEENGTAYYVMEYADGGSLNDLVKRQTRLSEDLATKYIIEVASALKYIHESNMTHLDVKPGNIMLNGKDEVVLIDFGLSKQYDTSTGSQTSSTPVGVSEGYAPMEQYRQGGVGEFSPESDIYSLGATFYKLLTGKTPPSALDVNEDGVPVNELAECNVSQAAINAILKAMVPRKKDRMKNAQDFIDMLVNPSAEASAGPVEVKLQTVEKKTEAAEEVDDDEQTLAPGQVEIEAMRANQSAKGGQQQAAKKPEAKPKAEKQQAKKKPEDKPKADGKAKGGKIEVIPSVVASANPSQKNGGQQASATLNPSAQPLGAQKKSKIGIKAIFGIVAGIAFILTLLLLLGSNGEDAVNEPTNEATTAVETPAPAVEEKDTQKDVVDYEIEVPNAPESMVKYKYTGKLDNELDALPQGKGVAHFPKAKFKGLDIPEATYEGQFKDGIPNDKTGKATYKFDNGRATYKGTFINGFYGHGRYTEADGSYFEGDFNEFTPYDGTWYTKNGVEDGKVKDGQEVK